MYMSYYTMIQLDNEEMVTDALVPAPLAAGLMYLLFTALREISSWSQGRLKEGEDGARPGRRGGEEGEGASPDNWDDQTSTWYSCTHFLSSILPPFPIPQ